MRIPRAILLVLCCYPATLGAQTPTPTSQCMEGMQMPGCPPQKPDTQAIQPPGTSMRNMQGMHTDATDTQAPLPQSSKHATQTLQESENPKRQTGIFNTPVPDLLKEVAAHPAMSLESFLTLAEQGHPTIAQAHALVRQSEQQAKQAGLYPNPSIGYQGEQIRGGSYGGGEQGGYVQQTIVLGGKLGLRRTIYNQQKAGDQIGVEEQTYRIHNDVAQSFYAALAAQGTVVVRQRLLKVALDAVQTAHQLANVGQADAPDVLQAEIEAEQAKVDYATAQRRFIQSFRTLAAITGKLDLPLSPIDGVLEVPPQLDTEHQVATILAENPAVKRAKQEVVIAEAHLHDARRETIPDLTLRAGEQYNGERITDSLLKSVGAQTFASASITLPLWNRNQGNIEAAKLEVQRSTQDVLRIQLALKQEAETLAQEYLASQFEADRYKQELIPRAQRAYDLYLQKYQAMSSAYPQVIVSQRTLFQLQIAYLKALQNVWSNAIALQNLAMSGALQSRPPRASPLTTLNLPNGGGAQE